MADVFNAQGKKIGYTNRQGAFVPMNSGAPFVNQPAYNGGYMPNQNQAPNKSSGAKYTKSIKFPDLYIVNAWRKTKHGLMRASCFPVDGVIHVGKEKGNEHVRYAVTISNSSAGTSQTYWCIMRLDTRKIVINELSLVISPEGSGTTGKGKHVKGYFGRNFKS